MNIYKKGNYIEFLNEAENVSISRLAANVEFRKDVPSSDIYEVFYLDSKLFSVNFNDIQTEYNIAYNSKSTFEKWYKNNTGTDTLPYYLKLVKGHFSNENKLILTASNINIGTSTETIANFSTLWTPPTVARTISFVSTSASDSAAGIGIRSFILSGVNASRELISETITLNGTTPVVSTLLYLGVNSILAASWGSSGVAVGNVTGTATTENTTQVQIEAGQLNSAQIIYHVPVGYNLYSSHFPIQVYKNANQHPGLNVKGFLILNGGKFTIFEAELQSDHNPFLDLNANSFPVISPGGSILYFTAVSTLANTICRMSVESILIKE